MLRAGSSALLGARSVSVSGSVGRVSAARAFSATSVSNLKVLCCLYEAGKASEEKRLLGCKENALGLRPWLESLGHTFVVTSDKEGPGCEFEKHLEDADIVITTPFHPGYITRDRLAKAKNLKVSITAGVGSDHVDIPAACDKKLAVYEVTGSNVTSVAEHVVMQILALVRNFIPAHEQIKAGEWRVADIARNAFDVEGKVIGTLGAGRIGYRVLQRLVPFEPKELLYADYQPLTKELEDAVGARRVSVEELFKQCDIITINTPLTAETKGMVNKNLLALTKKGVYIVNTARGAIIERDDLVDFVNKGHVAGYAGDVWFPQPAPKDHPWRYMPRNAMTPHYSGTTLDAQARYANGARLILENYFGGKPQQPKDIIAENGVIVSKAYDRAGKIETKAHVEKETYN